MSCYHDGPSHKVVVMDFNLELYDFCCKEGYADAALIAKWKKVCTVHILYM